MPRQAHGRPLQASKPSKNRKRKSVRSNALNALEAAEAENPDDLKIRQHRLGEIEDDSDDVNTRADADGRSAKRRKVNNDREDFEAGDEEGSDSDGGRWHQGVNEDDEDSDIDSEEAFGESDEERFAQFTFRGSEDRKPKTGKQSAENLRRQVVNLNEDEGWEDADAFNDDDETYENQSEQGSQLEEEEDDLGDDAVDLATALDMNEEEDRKEAERAQRKVAGKKDHKPMADSDFARDAIGLSEEGAEDNDDSDNSDEQDEDENASEFSVSDNEQGDVAGLQNFVAGLTPADRELKGKQRRETRALPEKPSMYGLGTANISAADLMQYVKDPVQRQSLKMLQASERQQPENYKGGIPGKLSAPLAKRQQDRLDRQAAYEKSKETLNRWIDTVKQNRRADHLSFPLADPAMQSATSTKALTLTSQDAPATALEAAIQNIMESSGISAAKGQSIEDQEQAFEELQEKQIPIEEVRARRAELRKARELMFREEVRSRRIKKIKSKAYRRVHRKERDRIEAQQHEQLAASGFINSDEEREKSERQRAEERMGARHRESRWAKAVKSTGRATWDEDARTGVSDLARRDEELRRRIEGKTGDDSDVSNDESDSDAVDTDAEDEQLVKRLGKINAEDDLPRSKLASMAFMLRSEAARKAENDEESRQLRLALTKDGENPSESDVDDAEKAGRQKFGASTKNQTERTSNSKIARREFEATLSEDEVDDEQDMTELASNTITSGVDHVSQPVSKQLPPRKSQPNQAGAKKASTKQSRSSQSNGKTAAVTSKLPSNQTQALDDYTSPSESEDEVRTPSNPDDAHAALAASIFAGPDNAVEDFAKEKEELVKEEDDQVIDNTLPGWGSWTGVGVSKREKAKSKGRFLTTVKGIAPDKRRDAKLERVIINEKKVKKNSKYLATELPHPFETRQQYERSLRLPMGPEWSTVNHFQDAIKPRVLMKQGSVIKPIAKPLA